MKKRSLIIIWFIAVFTGVSVKAQQADSASSEGFLRRIYRYFETSNEPDRTKRFDISFIGGPHYSSDTKLGLGLVASGLFRTDRADTSVSPSNVSLYGDFTTSGFYMLGIGGNISFPRDRYRLDADLFFSSMPSKYWGIGYENGRKENDYTRYTKKEMQIRLDFLVRLLPNMYGGITGSARYIEGVRFRDPDFLNGTDRNMTAVGGGVILSYDSRDFIPNPYRGVYLKLEQAFYPEFLGTSCHFNSTDITARAYHSFWKDGIVAFDLQGTFHSKDVPWSMMALLGNSEQMRGYFIGRYRDKKIIQTQVELRQKIYGRSGIAVWAGAGNVFPGFKDLEWKHTLPTFGAGYRWEFKKRVNIRLDYGIGRGESGFYFSINEAF